MPELSFFLTMLKFKNFKGGINFRLRYGPERQATFQSAFNIHQYLIFHRLRFVTSPRNETLKTLTEHLVVTISTLLSLLLRLGFWL